MGRRRKVVKLLLAAAVAVLLAVVARNWQLGYYLARQAQGQLEVVWGAVPVAEAMADPTVPDSVKAKLAYLQEVRSFAIDSLGLSNTDNYTTYYDHGQRSLMFVVSAAPPFEMTPHQWSFPLFGSFAYKGYFDSLMAIDEAERMKAQGLEVRLRTAAAWSTLGYFTDPILSGMLRRGPGYLAELLIHEMTHATLFVPDSTDFNENLATFIGEQGALQFLAQHYGADSKELLRYRQAKYDSRRWKAHMLRGKRYLEALYAGLDQEQDSTAKAQRKQAAIRNVVELMDTLGFAPDSPYADLFVENMPNNCYFLSLGRYNQSQDVLQADLVQHGGSLKQWIAALQEKYPSL